MLDSEDFSHLFLFYLLMGGVKHYDINGYGNREANI